MVNASKQKRSSPLLPESLTRFFKIVSVKSVGFLLWALFMGFVLAFVSYDPSDPSINHVSNNNPSNYLGTYGAYVADIFLNTIGAGSYLLMLPLLTWGWRLVRLKPVPWIWINLMALPFFALSSAAALSAFFSQSDWPTSTGAGGVLGQLLYDKLDQFIIDLNIVTPQPWIAGLAFLALATLLIAFTSALDKSEWAWLGHGLRRGVVAIFALPYRLIHQPKDTDEWDEYDDEDEDFSAATQESKPKKLAAPRKIARSKPTIAEPKGTKEGKRAVAERQKSLDLGVSGSFAPPTLDLLAMPKPKGKGDQISEESLEQNARLLESVLDDFGIKGEIVSVRPGPVVTLYELEPAPGTKSQRVISLADDIARSMSAISARVAVVPGRNAIGIELPNADREIVYLRELLSSEEFENGKMRLPMALGKDIGGGPVIADLAGMPHLLVAGTTGSGKSVGLNTMIVSLLYHLTPEQCRFIMVDPKMLELSVYDGIPHLLTPVVTEAKKAVVALKWAVREMEERYRAMSKLGVRNISAYNKKVTEAAGSGETLSRKVQTGFDKETGQPIYEKQEFDFEPLPLIVIVIDEMADLMLVAGKDVEATVQRLAQMARAAGLHVIMATQRPSVDVITGTIKANFPTRIGFQVTSKIDSRTILGEQGAEQLLGMGDMLYMAGGGRITRVHGPFVSDNEVEKIVTFLKKQGLPEYLAEVTEEPEEGFDSPFIPGPEGSAGDNELYDQAVAIVLRDRKVSTSYIQRRLKIGYNRAATLIEEMENSGLISEANHAGKREILVPEQPE